MSFYFVPTIDASFRKGSWRCFGRSNDTCTQPRGSTYSFVFCSAGRARLSAILFRDAYLDQCLRFSSGFLKITETLSVQGKFLGGFQGTSLGSSSGFHLPLPDLPQSPQTDTPSRREQSKTNQRPLCHVSTPCCRLTTHALVL